LLYFVQLWFMYNDKKVVGVFVAFFRAAQ
jgi:hypothetical protein